MNQKLHIILTGEQGQSRSFTVVKNTVKAFCYASLTVLICLSGMSIAGVDLFFQNHELNQNVINLSEELQAIRHTNRKLQRQVAKLDAEKKALLADAVEKLNEKSQLMESILNSVGIDIEVEESSENTGGPFTQLTCDTPDDLIFKANRYLEVIQYIPLGAPVPGVITSKFGRRIDPINSRPAFHNGVDIRGKRGTDVKATADGKVSKQGYDKGIGNYVVLTHSNGFRTTFGHLKKILVEKGGEVRRGQTIGLLGNSGRSTGPHVHYEISYQNKLVNPIKYMKIAKYISIENNS